MNGFVHVSPLSLCNIVCVCLCAHSSILFDCYYDDLHVRRDDCVICLFYLCNLCLAKRGFKIAHYVYDDHSYNQMSATAERWRDRDLQSCAIPFMQLGLHLRPSDFPKNEEKNLNIFVSSL